MHHFWVIQVYGYYINTHTIGGEKNKEGELVSVYDTGPSQTLKIQVQSTKVWGTAPYASNPFSPALRILILHLLMEI